MSNRTVRCIRMASSEATGRWLHRAGAVMMVSGIIGLLVRLILVVDHGRYNFGDVFLALVSAFGAIVGFIRCVPSDAANALARHSV